MTLPQHHGLNFTFVQRGKVTHGHLASEPFHDTETLHCWCAPYFLVKIDGETVEIERNDVIWQSEKVMVQHR